MGNYNGNTGLTQLIQLMKNKLDGLMPKVKKADGVNYKVLSDNDLTDALKKNYDAAYTHSQTAHASVTDVSANTAARHSHSNKSTLDKITEEKLAELEAGKNVIEKIKVNGTEQTVTDKTVDISVDEAWKKKVLVFQIDRTNYSTDENGVEKYQVILPDGFTSLPTEDEIKNATVILKYGTAFFPLQQDITILNTRNLSFSYLRFFSTTDKQIAKFADLTVADIFESQQGEIWATVATDVISEPFRDLSTDVSADGSSDSKTVSPKAVKTYVDGAISGITGLNFRILGSGEYNASTGVPTVAGATATIYLVPSGDETNNIYAEYIFVNSVFEKIGTTAVDMSGYWKKDDLTEMTADDVSEIWNAVFGA